MPQPSKAHGGTQLPRQGALAARPVDRLEEVCLGGRRGCSRVALQLEFTLDPQQFRDAPPLFVTLASRERVVDRCPSLGNPPGTGQALRKRAKKCRAE